MGSSYYKDDNRRYREEFDNDHYYQKRTNRYQEKRNSAPRKKSGAKYGMDKNGNPFVRGWKATRFGLITYLAVPTSKTGSHEGKTQTWQNWMVKVNPPSGMGNEYTTSGLFSEQTHKVIVATEGIVMNPNAPNGGYCGRFGGKR